MNDRSHSCRESDAEGMDIPPWLSLLVLFSVSSSLFVALALNSNPYLTSSSGYADGGDMYSHQVEALLLKDLLKNGTTDLWFDEVTLGYPFFLAYHPFPCLFTSGLMILTEPFITPLLLFRWMFVILLSTMPWSWFAGLRKLGMTRLEATLAALYVYSIHSWRKFGLELDAFQEYGIFTQAYGMAIFPLAVGFLYQYVLYESGSRNGTVLLVVLNFTAHTFFGIYLGVVTAVVVLIDLFSNPLPFKRKLSSSSIWRAAHVHVTSVFLMAWWILPLLINIRYVGGLPWKNDSENGYKFEFVVRNLLSGEMFDHGRKLPFITMGLLAGLSCVCLTYRRNGENDRRSKRQTLHIWLGMLFSVTIFLFLGRTTWGALYDLIPFHKEIEVLRYLNGIHFCGLLLMAVSFARIVRFLCATFCWISNSFFKSYYILMTVMLIIPPVYLSSQLQQINSLLTLTDTPDSLEGLKEMTSYPSNGRVLAQKVLGTGGPWYLALLPHRSKKPGILTYSRGYHDSLSLYYLELLQPNLDITPWFPDLLRLYNIRFLATSRTEVPAHFLEALQLSHLTSIDDIEVYVRAPEEKYGYFEFVHVPGAVVGDLKAMREAVSRSTQLFTHRILLAVNPSKASHNPPFEIAVSEKNEHVSFFRRFLSSVEFETSWFVNKMSVRETVFYADVKFGRDAEQVLSRVLEEEVGRNFYRAHVHVDERTGSENFYQTEHLLLKVTYHPFWKCAFHSSANTADQAPDWQDIPVHHVTPNLMSVVLPPGRHHVTCQYKNPIYQKVSFVLCVVIFLTLLINELTKLIQRR